MSASQIYQLICLSPDMTLSNVWTYSDFDVALKQFLKYMVRETRLLIEDIESVSTIDSDMSSDEETTSCVLWVMNHDPDSCEYTVHKEYDIDSFHDIIDCVDDVEGYLVSVQISLNDGQVPQDLKMFFTK